LTISPVIGAHHNRDRPVSSLRHIQPSVSFCSSNSVPVLFHRLRRHPHRRASHPRVSLRPKLLQRLLGPSRPQQHLPHPFIGGHARSQGSPRPCAVHLCVSIGSGPIR